MTAGPGPLRQAATAAEPRVDAVRLASVADAPEIARLLHDFNTEFSEPTPGAEVLAPRVERLIAADESTFLLAGGGPDGLAQIRFRSAVFEEGSVAYLEELYVVPARRGRGLGRALLDATLELARRRGAARIEVGTSEADTAALALYESAGFTNREGGPDGPVMFFYERDL
jgi:GNAT superfamily N-acetyltransferase